MRPYLRPYLGSYEETDSADELTKVKDDVEMEFDGPNDISKETEFFTPKSHSHKSSKESVISSVLSESTPDVHRI